MKYLFKPLIVVMILFLGSCEKSLEEVNIDPDTSPVANEAVILTASQAYLGYIVDVDLNSQSFLWAQYYTWGTGVSIGNAERFVANPDDHNGHWQRSYANALLDLKLLTKSNTLAYSGIGKILTAYVYQGLVDHYGDIPYSDALKGEISEGSVLTPTFDDDASIYGSLVTLVDDALTDLSTASSSDVGAEDLVFGGDVNKWTRFGNSLKLRLLMRTSELGGNDQAIKDLISNGIFLESDVAEIPYDGASGNQNPMFARFTWGVGDFYYGSNTTLDILKDLGDPRIAGFYIPATTGDNEGEFYSINQGTIDDELFTAATTDYTHSSPQAYGEANSVVLMSPSEVWFLRAEAAARYGTADDDEAAFGAAISANFDYLGVSGAGDYIPTLNYAAASSMDAKIDAIAVQKWIAMNGTQEDEGWIETRRFDRPASRLFTQGIFATPPLSILGAGNFPSAWLYPATERALNPNCPAQRVITDKIFWDN